MIYYNAGDLVISTFERLVDTLKLSDGMPAADFIGWIVKKVDNN